MLTYIKQTSTQFIQKKSHLNEHIKFSLLLHGK